MFGLAGFSPLWCGSDYWFGLVWFGLVWFGLVWFGTAWYGMQPLSQVMETKSMLYLVSEYVPNGEIFGKSLTFLTVSLLILCFLFAKMLKHLFFTCKSDVHFVHFKQLLSTCNSTPKNICFLNPEKAPLKNRTKKQSKVLCDTLEGTFNCFDCSPSKK